MSKKSRPAPTYELPVCECGGGDRWTMFNTGAKCSLCNTSLITEAQVAEVERINATLKSSFPGVARVLGVMGDCMITTPMIARFGDAPITDEDAIQRAHRLEEVINQMPGKTSDELVAVDAGSAIVRKQIMQSKELMTGYQSLILKHHIDAVEKTERLFREWEVDPDVIKGMQLAHAVGELGGTLDILEDYQSSINETIFNFAVKMGRQQHQVVWKKLSEYKPG